MAKTNNKSKSLFTKLLIGVVLAGCLVTSLATTVLAQTVNQGYNSDKPLQKGMLVATKSDDQTKVEPVNKDSIERLKGVIVQQNDSPVTLAGAGQNVFVATSGLYEALVSNENGEIKKGDYITISSFEGIAMKAGDSQAMVLGTADADFNGKDGAIGSTEDPKTKQKVTFARIPVAISVNRNPMLKEEQGNSIPKVLQKVSVTVAGKKVNTARIWLATAVFLGTAFVVGVMLYSGARSSLISVGRNPLSRTVIIRGLLQVVIVSLIVFITGMFGVYLLLKL